MMMKKLLVLLALILLSSAIVQSQGYPETAYIAWHPNGTMLAIAYKTRVDIFFFSRDADHGGFRVTNSLTDIQTSSPPAWSPDGNRIAFSNDTDVEVWSTPWDSSLAQLVTVYQHFAPNTPLAQTIPVTNIAFSLDGNRIASSAGTGVDIWNSSTSELILRLPGEDFIWDWVTDLKWTEDNRLGIANISGWIPIVDTNTGETISVYKTGGASYNYGSWALDFSPDGNQLAIGGSEEIIEIWGDTRVIGELVEGPTLNYYSHLGLISTLDWNPLGQFIASGDTDGRIRVWDAETGEDYWVTDLGAGVHVDTVAWSPDGTQLAYMDVKGELQIIPFLDDALENVEDEE